MAVNLTSPISILNFVELVLSIIITGLISNLGCLVGTTGKAYELQFIDGTVFGYLIVNIIITLGIVTGSELNKTLRLAISGVGAVLWLAAAALMLQSADAGYCQLGESYDRAIAAGILGLAAVVVYAVDCFFVFKHSD